MSKKQLISLLAAGDTGNDILTILDMLAADSNADSVEPTLEEIEF